MDDFTLLFLLIALIIVTHSVWNYVRCKGMNELAYIKDLKFFFIFDLADIE